MGDLVPFRRPRREIVPPSARRERGCTIVLSAQLGAVMLGTHDTDHELTPEQARSLAEDLIELADDAEAR